MAQTAIDIGSSHRVEADGTHTVMVQISGLPNIAMANKVSNWMHSLVRENAQQIGRLAEPSKVQ